MKSAFYKRQLLKLAVNLEKALGRGYGFEKIVEEITDEQSDFATINFVQLLLVIAQDPTVPDISPTPAEVLEVLYLYLGTTKVEGLYQEFDQLSTIPLDQLLDQLDALVGLEKVKQQVRDLIDYHHIQQLRLKKGLKKSHKTLHMAFLGNPGTAKTTVARIVGRMYKAIGILSKGHFIEASRTDLIAEYQGQTAIKVKRLMNRAKGGVLFIDEAYSITENDHSDSYGRECLTELTKALEDYRDDLVVIVAGYTNLMEQFFESNPGLRSRFNTFISFDDYSLDELVQIFQYICDQNDYVVEEQAIEKVRDLLQMKLKEQEGHFANGRLVRNVFDDIIVNQCKRLATLTGRMTKKRLMSITKEDVPHESCGSMKPC